MFYDTSNLLDDKLGTWIDYGQQKEKKKITVTIKKSRIQSHSQNIVH